MTFGWTGPSVPRIACLGAEGRVELAPGRAWSSLERGSGGCGRLSQPSSTAVRCSVWRRATRPAFPTEMSKAKKEAGPG